VVLPRRGVRRKLSLEAIKSCAASPLSRSRRVEAQSRAIAALDTAAVASFWTEDVEIRRGLGVLVTGREAYKRLFNPDSGAVARGEELIYQREPASVEVSARWALAYEEGTWAGHLRRADGPVLILASVANRAIPCAWRAGARSLVPAVGPSYQPLSSRRRFAWRYGRPSGTRGQITGWW
jgi:hypothetical protein